MAGNDDGIITLEEIIEQFATAMRNVDRRAPRAVNPLTGHVYQPGIGPHPEDRAVDLILLELAVQRPHWRWRIRACHGRMNHLCDWLLGDPVQWAIEIKMARPNKDNGKPHDTGVTGILSPYPADRSALSECVNLARSGITSRLAIVIYGFDDLRRPLTHIISAFETLAKAQVNLGVQRCAPLGPLVHPVHKSGAVYGWEIYRRVDP